MIYDTYGALIHNDTYCAMTFIVQASAETLQCPRCSASVPSYPGVCNNCGENVFQCHKCRLVIVLIVIMSSTDGKCAKNCVYLCLLFDTGLSANSCLNHGCFIRLITDLVFT